MRYSNLYAPTLKEDPTDAEVVSHKLMLRAAMMRKVGSGIYTYLTLGQRVIQKVEQIVREELNKAGAQEVLMPALHPADLWKQTGRLEDYGPQLMRLEDRNGREYCLGPTHEEIITTLVRNELRSYKELPVNMYQFQTKYRDEIRPRFGVLRSREFIMKDGYSFNKTEEGLDKSYENMYQAYSRIFDRCGLDYRPVEAYSGPIGGSKSHEFMVLAESGEDSIVYCENCDYSANVELARSKTTHTQKEEEPKEMKRVETPDAATIKEVEEMLDIPAKKMLKAMLYQTKDEIILALVRGNDEVNEVKLKDYLEEINLEMADDEVYQKLNTVKGFTGPIELDNVRVIIDELAAEITNGVSGANEKDYHYINVNPERDFEVDEITDIRRVKEGEKCVECGNELIETEGIEAGQIFKLGTKYSEALDATFLDNNGKSKPFIMGCYGIGITRTVAAAIEQNYDENGIIWPKSLAPFKVHIVQIGNGGEVKEAADNVYNQLQEDGIEVLIDDRAERAGVKFNDADLIGCPLQVIIGSRGLENNNIEIKMRKNGKSHLVSKDKVFEEIKNLLADY